MKKTLIRVVPRSLARTLGIIYLILGAVFSILFVIPELLLVDDSKSMGPIGAALFVVLVPFGYGLLGWVAGHLGARLYNAVAQRFGGIEFEVESSEQQNQSP